MMSSNKRTGQGAAKDEHRRLIETARKQILDARRRSDQHPGSSTGAAASTEQLLIRQNDLLPGYRLLGPSYRGGQAVVYQAIQQTTGRRVALKFLHGGPMPDPRRQPRFEREVRILGQLKHPNIVTIHDSGHSAAGVYLVMDYIDGIPLDQWIASVEQLETGRRALGSRPRSKATVRRLLSQGIRIAEAVNAAHLRGIIHRDLKPANILIDSDDEPHILDFGLARLVDDDSEGYAGSAQTQDGQFIGSMPWASPEQAEGHPDEIDLRTDVYSLGVILYQMLTGEFPYAISGRLREVISNIVSREPSPPSRIRPGIDDEVNTIILKCLAKDREQRYQSAGDLARDIRRYLDGEPIAAKGPNSWYILRKTARRHRAAASIASLFVLLTAAFAVVSSIQSAQTAAERDRARSEADQSRRIQEFLESMFGSIRPDAVPHEHFAVRHVLDDGARRVEQEFADLPDIAADIHETLGQTYNSLGLYAEAIHQHRRGLQFRRQAFGTEHPSVAASLANLAISLHDNQDLAEAEDAAREAVRLQRRLLGPDHPNLAESIDRLASILSQRNFHDEAAELAREGLQMRRRHFLEESPEVAGSLTTWGACLMDLGRFGDAEQALANALQMVRVLYGRNSLNEDGILTRMAELHHMQGQMDLAEARLREVIDLRRWKLGNQHPALAWNLYSLGTLLLEQGGDLTEAETLCREAYQIQLDRIGPEHADIAQYIDALAQALIANSRFAEAAVMLCKSWAVKEGTLGPDHNETIRTRNILNDLGYAECSPEAKAEMD